MYQFHKFPKIENPSDITDWSTNKYTIGEISICCNLLRPSLPPWTIDLGRKDRRVPTTFSFPFVCFVLFRLFCFPRPTPLLTNAYLSVNIPINNHEDQSKA